MAGGIMAPQVRFGLTLSNRGVRLGLTTPDELLEVAGEADAAHVLEHVWVGDQIMAKPRMESLTLMAALAARTRRVKIGVACMASLPSRHPVLLAYQWASLDLLSHGRMILGACMGVPESSNLARIEHVNGGLPSAERAPRVEEGLAILRKLWREERVTFDGRFYTLQAAFVEPKPVQTPPPIWVIGNPSLRAGSPLVIERNLRRVARLGGGWVATARPAPGFARPPRLASAP